MSVRNDDESLDYFLELDGTVHFVDDKCNYRVEIRVCRSDVTPERRHGLSYSVTLHGPDQERIIGFDNAHSVAANRGPSGKKHKFYDHRHRYGKIRIYNFVDTITLLSDFYKAVELVLKEKGVKK